MKGATDGWVVWPWGLAPKIARLRWQEVRSARVVQRRSAPRHVRGRQGERRGATIRPTLGARLPLGSSPPAMGHPRGPRPNDGPPAAISAWHGGLARELVLGVDVG